MKLPRLIFVALLSILTAYAPHLSMATGATDPENRPSSVKNNHKVREAMLLSLVSAKDLSLKEEFLLMDSLIRLSPDKIDYLLRYSSAAMHLGEFVKAEKALNHAANLAEPDSLARIPQIKLQQIRLNRMQGKIVNAVVDATELLNLKKPDSLKYLDIEVTLFLSDGYLNMGSEKLAKLYHQNARQLIQSNKENLSKVKYEDFLNNSYAIEAQTVLYSGDKEKALNLVLEAMKHPASNEHTVFLKLLMGAILEELHEYSRAAAIYQELLDSKDATWWNAMALPRYVNMMMVENKPMSVDSIVNRYADLSSMIRQTHRGITMDFIRASILHTRGDEEKAWEMITDAYKRLDQFAYYHAHASRQADVIYDIMTVKQQEYKTELIRAKRLLWIEVAVLILSLIIFFFMLRKFKQKKRLINQLKSNLNNEITDFKEKERKFHNRLQSRNHETMAVTMQLSRFNELFDVLNSKINAKTSPEKTLEDLKKLISSADYTKNFDKLLKVQFSQTHGNLLERLSERHPNITPGEQKMAMYILLGYSTREIADLTFRSPRSVETMKYRMVKKLLPDSDVTLDVYLKSFLTDNEGF